jgi:hypothetical protein
MLNNSNVCWQNKDCVNYSLESLIFAINYIVCHLNGQAATDGKPVASGFLYDHYTSKPQIYYFLIGKNLKHLKLNKKEML